MIKDARAFLDNNIDRRTFLNRLTQTGLTLSGATTIADSLASDVGPAADMQTADGPTGIRTLHDATGGELIAEFLIHWDIPYVFGLSGSEEVGFWDALVDREDKLKYATCLHEHVAMAMADGYSRSTGKTSLVVLHSIAGAAYAFGQLVSSFRDRIPVVVTAGRQSSNFRGHDGFLEAANLHIFPKEYTQWTWDVMSPGSIPETLRRAFLLAESPPGGPAFVTFSKDMYEERIPEAELLPRARSRVSRDIMPPEHHVIAIADGLIEADFPTMLIGNEAIRDDVSVEAMAIAEMLGIPVMNSFEMAMVVPTNHPNYVATFMADPQLVSQTDTMWSIGSPMFKRFNYEGTLVNRNAKIFQTGLDDSEVGRNYPVDSAAIANIRSTAAAVLEELNQRDIKSSAIDGRKQWMQDYSGKRRKRLDDELARVWDQSPISLPRLYTELDRTIEPDACVVQELVTSLATGLDYFTIDYQSPPAERRQSYGTTSGVLGWGMSAAIGVAMGNPDREIWCLTADGSFNFGVQALWSAARYEAPIGFIVFNNGQYQANRHAMSHYPGRMQNTGRFPGVHLSHPDIKYVSLADGYGVEGERVEKPSDLAAALRRAKRSMSEGRPYLVDVSIETIGSYDASWYDYFSIATGNKIRG